MPISVEFLNCPHCVDSFAFDFQKLTSLTLHSRVRVRCPRCGKTVEVVTDAYSLIHGADPNGDMPSLHCHIKLRVCKSGWCARFAGNAGWSPAYTTRSSAWLSLLRVLFLRLVDEIPAEQNDLTRIGVKR